MSYVNDVLQTVLQKNPGEPEFHQAVTEVLQTLEPVLARHPEYEAAGILERLTEPDRAIRFRVTWVGRRRQSAGKPRLPRTVQQCDRPLQRRPALPSERKLRNPEVFGI